MKNITDRLNEVEDLAVDVLAVFGPWFAPIPSAYLVGKAAHDYLEWYWLVAIIAAVAVESIGVVSVVLALRLYEWNETKNKTDAAAPLPLALVNVAVYFVVTIGLTVLLDVVPELSRFAPAIFPLLAAVGAVNIAVKNGQRRREAEKVQARVDRQRAKSTTSQPDVNRQPVNHPSPYGELTPAQQRIFNSYRETPGATQAEIAERLGITKQAVSKHVRAMNGVMHEVRL